MKFKQYINEGYQKMDDITIYGLNELIQKDCAYYLKLIKGNEPLFRGMNTRGSSIGKKSVRQDREPYGMNVDEAKNFNKWLKKNGHTDRSKSVIATGDFDNVEMFGDAYFIFPVGKFNYTWIKAKDVNMGDLDTKWKYEYIKVFSDNNSSIYSFTQQYPDFSIDDLKKWFTTNKGFHIAQKNGYEIWMDCKSYYYVRATENVWNTNKGKFW